MTLLREPMTIAFLAALGLHGVAGLTLPMWAPPTDPEPDQQRQVNLIQLSPAEQLRLPPSAATSNTPQPTPSIPSFNLNATPYQIPPSDSSSAGTGTASDSSGPIDDQPPDHSPAEPTPTAPPTKPTKESNQYGDDNTVDKGVTTDRTTTHSDKSGKPAKPDTKPSTTEPKAPSARDLQSPTNQRGGDLVAAELTRKYGAYNPANTQQGEMVGNISQFANNLKNLEGANMQDWTADKVTEQYPQEACPFRAKGYVLVGAVLTDGKIDVAKNKPVILRSSGYAGLNEFALNYVSTKLAEITVNKRPITDSKLPAIMVPFEFDPEAVCKGKA